jgi:hypothetical protein
MAMANSIGEAAGSHHGRVERGRQNPATRQEQPAIDQAMTLAQGTGW